MLILSLGQINSLQLLAARTGGRAYPVEVCRQGKCHNARLQKTAVRQASVWVRCIWLWHAQIDVTQSCACLKSSRPQLGLGGQPIARTCRAHP